MTVLLLLAFQLAPPPDFSPIHQQRIERLSKAHGPAAPETRAARRDLGLYWLRQGQPALAEPHLRAAQPDPAVTPFLAEALAAQNRHAEAEAVFKECPSNPRCLGRLADYASRRNDTASAIRLLRQALTNEPTGPRRNDLALALQAAGEIKEAESQFRLAARLQEKSPGPNHPETATTWNNLASLLVSAERYPEAEPLQRRALRTMERTLGPGHVRTGLSASNLADILRALGRNAEAIPLYRQALEIFERQLPPGHPWIREAREALAAR